MKTGIVSSIITVALVAAGGTIFAEKGSETEGAELFKQHCAVCHPDGGNIINPKKTLHKKDMEANKIKTVDDIVKVMRNPGPGMIKFEESRLSNEKARKIGEYILKTYSK